MERQRMCYRINIMHKYVSNCECQVEGDEIYLVDNIIQLFLFLHVFYSIQHYFARFAAREGEYIHLIKINRTEREIYDDHGNHQFNEI